LPETTFVRYTRRTLIACVIAIPVLIAASILLRKMGRWAWSNWSELALMGALALGLVAALVRLSHALWVSTQYVLGELMLTFFAAAVVSLGLIEWMKYDPAELHSARAMNVYTIAIVAVTFMLFLSGSAWAWSLLRRANDLSLSRVRVLICGWSAAIGVMCFAAFLLFALIFAVSGGIFGPVGKYFHYLIPGILLIVPGMRVELRTRGRR